MLRELGFPWKLSDSLLSRNNFTPAKQLLPLPHSTSFLYTKDVKKNNPYKVLYCDDSLVAVSKRSGLLVAQDRYDLAAPRLDLELEKEFGNLFALHRIDKDTSGVVVYARTPEAHRTVSLQFQNRQVEKIYHALINGRPAWKTHREEARLLPDGDAQHRTIVHKRKGKPSVTEFTVLAICPPYTWVEARLITGRTHQIRAHLWENGLSIVCDPLYGGNQKPVRLSEIKRSWRGDPFEERPLLERLALHAYQLTLTHPVSGERITFTAPYPRDLDAVRKQLSKIHGQPPLVSHGDSI